MRAILGAARPPLLLPFASDSSRAAGLGQSVLPQEFHRVCGVEKTFQHLVNHQHRLFAFEKSCIPFVLPDIDDLQKMAAEELNPTAGEGIPKNHGLAGLP